MLLLLTACERTVPPPVVTPTTTPATSSTTAPVLRDWPLQPVLVESERNTSAPRLVSAAPALTELCCALGLGHALIARTRYCDYPPSVLALPSIGALNDLNAELLVTLKPNLVLVSGTSRAITDKLDQLGLRFESLPDNSLADLFTSIDRIGTLTGRPESARVLAAGINADLATVDAAFAHTPPARVLLVVDTLADPPAPPFVAGPGSFYDELLRRAGHHNAATSLGRPFGQLSLEFVRQTDPDVIIELDPDGQRRPDGDASARPAWAKLGPLRAVAAERVHVLRGPQHYLLGPRIAETYAAFCAALASAPPASAPAPRSTPGR